MTTAEYDDYIAYCRQHFEEGLIRVGFRESDTGWRGMIAHADGSTEVMISFGVRFPFRPPRVVPVDPDSVEWSWHRELDGALCLVAEDDHDDLWWTEASAFLAHVTAWFEQARAGWPDDRPDLDLERYFQFSDDKRLYLYDDLTGYPNGFVRFRPSGNNTMRIGSGTRPPKTSRHGKDRFGYVADLGDIDVPPKSWQDVTARIAPNVDLDRRIRNHFVEIVVLIYRRGTHDGTIVLEVWPTKDGKIAVRCLRATADTIAAKTARAGLVAPLLHEARVAIVGVGALGSFTVDMLVRAGIRRITLIDDDIVMPGNLIRHLVGPEMVGLPKVVAVKRYLVSRHEIAAENINELDKAVSSGDVAMELLTSHDLVVDTSADFATTALLHVAARSARKRIVSASIQNEGTTYRVDILPPFKGANALPVSSVVDQQPPRMFEAGCGSPISPTPPHVAVEAASVTVRHVIGLLIERPVHPSGEVRNLDDPARIPQ
ncbi:ThiF family adenylyltransferase [Frigoribacterium sp. CFBP9039]|uniref:HesA/MoeB/ThiF family protein n=1 Tax=Frigoribacterium sp. CFBP9029 TaxID=3096541 RepID=UPI002A6A468E|nr:ThiF family adenylyltransferase [Frigoribacterium sp. CFBP9039]MDY0947066.1 ThiF family adenylyltransferase [Frigoribacterium sp. CFBP9039]